MSTTGASPVHDHRVKTVKALDHKEVTAVDLAFRDLDLVDWSLFRSETHASLDEVEVCILHVRWSVGSNDWNVRVQTQATDERFKSVENRQESVLKSTTEMPHLQPTKTQIDFTIKGNREVESVGTFKVEGLDVLDFCVGEENVVVTEGGLLVGGSNVQVEVSVIDLQVLDIEVPAPTSKSNTWVSFIDVVIVHREEIQHLLIVEGDSCVASVDRLLGKHVRFFKLFAHLCSHTVQVSGLSFIVHVEGSFGQSHSSVGSFTDNLLLSHATEGALILSGGIIDNLHGLCHCSHCCNHK